MELKLRTTDIFTGKPVPNPFAQTVQEVLHKLHGHDIPVDGLWGDCSQQSLKSEAQSLNSGVVTPYLKNVFGVSDLGINPQIKLWDKSNPWCPNFKMPERSNPNEYENPALLNDENYQDPDYWEPKVMFARNFNLNIPENKLCAEGYTPNYQRGSCDKKKNMLSIIQKFSASSRLPVQNLKLTPLATLTKARELQKGSSVQPVSISSDKTYRITPQGASPPEFTGKVPPMPLPKPGSPVSPALIAAGLVGVLAIGLGIYYVTKN
jgi:hypothetical protein